MDTPSDAELIRRILGGDPEPYAAIVQRYQERLFRHALGMVQDRDAAADLVQDALIKAYQSLSACQTPERFDAWVFQILRNGCRDYLKAPRRRTVALEDIELAASRGSGPDYDVEQAETASAIERALAALPQAQREAFLLKHVEDFSYEEMAERLGAGVGALKMRVMRAREALQAALTEQRDGSPRDLYQPASSSL